MSGNINLGWYSMGLNEMTVNDLIISEDHLYAAAGKNGIYRTSTCSESSWEFLGLEDSTLENTLEQGIKAIYVDEIEDIIYAGFNSDKTEGVGMYKSSDNGISWQVADNGIATQEHPWSSNIYSIAGLSTEGILLAGLSASIFKSNNRGDTWSAVRGSRDYGGLGVNVIKFSDISDNVVWAGGQTGFFAPFVAKSEDYGEIWESIAELPLIGPFSQDNAVYDIAIDPLNSCTLYLGMLGMILKSTNCGEEWEMILDWQDGVFDHWKISVNPENPDELFATGGYLYHSLDGGNSWEKLKPEEEIKAIYALANIWRERILYVSTSASGIYRLKY